MQTQEIFQYLLNWNPIEFKFQWNIVLFGRVKVGQVKNKSGNIGQSNSMANLAQVPGNIL